MIFIEIFFCKRNTSIGEVIPKNGIILYSLPKSPYCLTVSMQVLKSNTVSLV